MSEGNGDGAMGQFVPKDPEYEAKVKESFSSQKYMNFIGAKITDLAPGFCEIQLPFKEELTQQHGYFHAGIIGTLSDNAGGYAAMTLMVPGSTVLAVEYKINFLAPGDGEVAIARANVIKPGKTLIVCEADVFVKKGGEEKLCAKAQMTMFQDRIQG